MASHLFKFFNPGDAFPPPQGQDSNKDATPQTGNTSITPPHQHSPHSLIGMGRHRDSDELRETRTPKRRRKHASLSPDVLYPELPTDRFAGPATPERDTIHRRSLPTTAPPRMQVPSPSTPRHDDVRKQLFCSLSPRASLSGSQPEQGLFSSSFAGQARRSRQPESIFPNSPSPHSLYLGSSPKISAKLDLDDQGTKHGMGNLVSRTIPDSDASEDESEFDRPSADKDNLRVGVQETDVNTERETPRTEPQLCPEQAELVGLIASGRNVFYTGSAGCGKSTVLKAFTKRLRSEGKKVDIIAPTGRAALEVGGTTTWTYAGWNPDCHKLPIKDLRGTARRKHVRRRLRDTDVLVIDEISMVENLHLERLNVAMKEARGNEYDAFGGVQVVVTGDFYQLPPVKPFQHCIECGKELIANPTEDSYRCKSHGMFYDEDKWAFRSKAWKECDFVHFHLSTIHRQSDATFIRMLQKCRVGAPLTARETLLLADHPCKVAQATKLFATREEVRRVNQAAFDRLTSRKRVYPCLDESNWNRSRHPHLEAKATRRYPDESLAALEDHRYERRVELKLGMLVVLLANLDLNIGLCNGSQGLICGFEDFDPAKLPKAAMLRRQQFRIEDGGDGHHEMDTEYAIIKERQILEFIERRPPQERVWPVVRFHNGATRTIFADCAIHQLGDDRPYTRLSRTQIPLAAAWAMSIHKSQSLTLGRVVVDLSRAFEEGQAYVALSRATSLEGLKVEGDVSRGLARSVGRGANAEVNKFYRQRFPQLRLEELFEEEEEEGWDAKDENDVDVKGEEAGEVKVKMEDTAAEWNGFP